MTYLFNPYTGQPRNPSDIKSDPKGLLIVDPENKTMLAANNKIINIPYDATVRNELASMVYERYCRAYNNLKITKTLTWESTNKFCPKNEWPQYHTTMIASAEKKLAIALMLKDKICKYSPFVIGE